jgi:hypothetical protein
MASLVPLPRALRSNRDRHLALCSSAQTPILNSGTLLMGESRVRGVGPDVCCHAIYAPSTASLDRLQSVAGKRSCAGEPRPNGRLPVGAPELCAPVFRR